MNGGGGEGWGVRQTLTRYLPTDYPAHLSLTAGGPVTQNLSCWDYLIGVNHRLIVEFPQMFFQIMLAPGNMDSQSFGLS